MDGTGDAAYAGDSSSIRRVLLPGPATGEFQRRFRRTLHARGVHVSLIIIDGVVGGPQTRARFPEHSEDFFVRPEAVVDIARSLTPQDRSAWSFEVEARPFGEKW
jgi:hypothetical protein